MPSILAKTVYEKAFIASKAHSTMMQTIDIGFSDEIIDIIIDVGCNNINKKLKENSYCYLGELINHINKSYFKE